MKKRIVMISMLLILAICMISGCEKKESTYSGSQTQTDSVKSNYDKKDQMFPSEYKAEVKNVTFSCEVLAPEKPVLTTASAQKAYVDCLSLGEKLIENETIMQSTIWDSNGTDTAYEGKKTITSQDIESNVEAMYTFGEQSMINIGRNSVYYFNNWNAITDILNLGQEDEGYNGELFVNNKEFDFSSQGQVLDKLQTLIHMYSDVEETMQKTYFIDSEELNKIKIQNDDTAIYTTEDDGYYICMRQRLQGLPVQGYDVDNYITYAGNAPIIAYYTKSGWRELIIDGSMLYKFETTDAKIQLKDFDKVIKTVGDYYNAMITENTYEVYRAELFNFVSKNGLMTPVWVFKIYEKYPDGYFRCDQLNVNAITGEVFTIYD